MAEGRHDAKGVVALCGGGARGVAGRGDERSAAAGPDSAVRLPGTTGVAAAGGSAPGRQPTTAHVQTRIALCKTLLHMQQKFVMGAGGNGWAATALRLEMFVGRSPANRTIPKNPPSLRHYFKNTFSLCQAKAFSSGFSTSGRCAFRPSNLLNQSLSLQSERISSQILMVS